MKSFSQTVAIASLFLLASSVLAQRGQLSRTSENDAEARSFGPYIAIVLDAKIVRDVKVDKEESVFLQLNPNFKDKELMVKISDERFGGYRTWWHGKYELISPANAGKKPLDWTDRVQSKAKYIEYWMDGDVFLHLKKVH